MFFCQNSYVAKKLRRVFLRKQGLAKRTPDACGRGSSLKKGKVMKIRAKTFIHGSNIILTTEEHKSKGKRKVTQE